MGVRPPPPQARVVTFPGQQPREGTADIAAPRLPLTHGLWKEREEPWRLTLQGPSGPGLCGLAVPLVLLCRFPLVARLLLGSLGLPRYATVSCHSQAGDLSRQVEPAQGDA